MYALIYKDFLLLKKQLLYVLVLAVFYTVIAVSGFLSASILPGHGGSFCHHAPHHLVFL